MPPILAILIKKELSHLDRLSFAAQRLLASSVLYEIGLPILLTFTNAYILKATGDFNAIAFFMLGTYITTALGFYINGWLLQRFSIKKIFTVGLIFQSLFTLPIYFVGQVTIPILFVIGLVLGFPIAFYWGNRNFLSLTVTRDDNRNYYSALESMSSTFIGILVPPIIGFLIVSGTQNSAYNTLDVYRFLTLVSSLVMGAAGLILRSKKSHTQNFDIKNPVIKKHFLKKVDKNWSRLRLIKTIWGFQNGVNIFLSGALIIFLVGNEAALGSLQSLTAVLTATSVYIVGKKTLPKDRLPQMTWSLLCSLFTTILFSIFYNSWAVIIYVLGSSIAGNFIGTSLNPTLQKVLDDQENGDPTNNYAYVTDEELFLNLGRAIGILLFYFLSTQFSQMISLRITPVILAGTQLTLIYLVKSIPFNNASATLSKKVK